MIDILHIFMQDEYKFAKSLISMITDEKCFEKQQHLFIKSFLSVYGYFGEKRAVFHRPSFSVNEFFIYNYLANNQCRFS